MTWHSKATVLYEHEVPFNLLGNTYLTCALHMGYALTTVASREWPQLGMGLQHVHFCLTRKKVLRKSSGGMRSYHTHTACFPTTWESTAQNDSTKWSVNHRLRALFRLERLQGKIKALGGIIAPTEEHAASKAVNWPACRVFECQDACLFL